MATLAELNVVIGAKIDDFEANMGKVQDGIGRLGDYAKSAGQSLSAYVTAPLTLLAGAAIKTAADMEALRTGFAATYKGAEPLSVALARVTELAKLPGLGLREALQGATSLQAAGFSAEQAAKSLGAFGNALATVGKGKAELDSVSLALTQINNTPFVQGQDLNQLRQALPQIGEAMKKAFGATSAEDLRALGITSKQFIEGITNEFAKLPTAAGGLKNALENLSDAGTLALSKLGDSLNRNFDLTGLSDKISKSITAAVEAFDRLSPAAQKTIFVLAGIAATAGPVLFAIGSIGLAVPALTVGFGYLTIAATAAWAAATGPIGLLVIGLVGVGASVYALIEQFGSVEQAAAHFGGAIAQLAADGLTALRDGLRFLGFPILGELIDLASVKAQALADKLFSIATPAKELSGSFAAAFQYVPDYFRDIDGAITKTGGLLADLEAQLKAAKDARPALTSEADILASNLLIQSLEAQIKRLNELGIASDKMRKAYEEVQKSLRDVVRENQALGDVYDLIAAKQSALESGIKKLVDAGFSPFSREVRALVQELQKVPDVLGKIAQIELKQDVALKVKPPELPATLKPTKLPPVDNSAFKKTLTDTEIAAQQFGATIAQGFEGVGVAIGNALFTGADVVQAAGAALLKGLGDLAVKKGSLLIAEGTADLFIPGLQGLGAATIAAGTGLVAAGTLVGAYASSAGGGSGGVASGGGGGGSSLASSPRSSFTPTPPPAAANYTGPVKYEHVIKFELKGSTVAGLLSIEQDRLGRLLGR